MARVLFNCSQCSTQIESAEPGVDVHMECPSCGKSLTIHAAAEAESAVRGRSRRMRYAVAGVLAVALGIGVAVWHLKRTATPAAAARARTGRSPLVFLKWDRLVWEEWMRARNWEVSADSSGNGSLLGHTDTGADVAIRFRPDGLPANISIVGPADGDELRPCLKAAYVIDPLLARALAAMVKHDPEVMSNGRRYRLANTPYAMGGAERALLLDYVGPGDGSGDIRRLPAAP